MQEIYRKLLPKEVTLVNYDLWILWPQNSETVIYGTVRPLFPRQTAALWIPLEWHTEGNCPPLLPRGLKASYLDSCTHQPDLIYTPSLDQIK